MSTDIGNLWQFKLTKGSSRSPRRGACVLDAVSWFQYGHLGDHPPCVCPVIAEYCREINDLLPFRERQRLRAYIPRLVGTLDHRAEIARGRRLVRFASRDLDSKTYISYIVFSNRYINLSCVSKARYVASCAAEVLHQARRNKARREAVVAAIFQGLDEMLAIGRQAEPVDVPRYVQAVESFAKARGETVHGKC